MPALDTGRGRARLTPSDLALLADLPSTDPDVLTAPRLPVLEAAGLVRDGAPADEVAALLPLLSGAELVLDVATTCRTTTDGVVALTVLRHAVHLGRGQALVVESFPGTDEVDLGPVEIDHLPVVLTRLVGLRPRPLSPVAPARLPAALVSDLLAGLVTPEQGRAAEPVLRSTLPAQAPWLTADQVEAVSAVLARRQAAWSVLPRPADGAGAEGVSVLDGGPTGWWQRGLATEPGHLVLAPVTAEQLAERVSALLTAG